MNNNGMPSKERQVLQFLLEGNSITPLEALRKFGLYRVAVAVCRLRKQGWDIRTEKVLQPGGWFARYRLTQKPGNDGR